MQAVRRKRNTRSRKNLNFTQVYTSEKTREIKKKARLGIAGFTASAILFSAICAMFCALAVFDFVSAYLGCAFCTVLTVLFLWYGYLFFTVYFEGALSKYKFIKYLGNAKPSYVSGVFIGQSEEEKGYIKLCFADGVFLWDGGALPFKEGREYELALIKDTVVGYCEAENE